MELLFTHLLSQNEPVTVRATGPGWILGTGIALMKFMAKVWK